MKYEFGVGTQKWSLESISEEVAKISMCLHIGKNIPIAIYSPESKAFMPDTILGGSRS